MITIGVNADGRITIPADFRRQLGWEKGTLVRVVQRDDGSVMLCRAVTTDEEHHEAAEAATRNGRT